MTKIIRFRSISLSLVEVTFSLLVWFISNINKYKIGWDDALTKSNKWNKIESCVIGLSEEIFGPFLDFCLSSLHWGHFNLYGSFSFLLYLFKRTDICLSSLHWGHSNLYGSFSFFMYLFKRTVKVGKIVQRLKKESLKTKWFWEIPTVWQF